MELTRIQFALFFGREIESPTELFIRLRQRYDSVFDDEPVITPWPKEAPSDAPSVIMRSKQQGSSINIAKSRMDLFVNCLIPGSMSWNSSVKMFMDIFSSLAAEIGISRIGSTLTFFKKSDEPVGEIAEDILKRALCDGADEILIRFNEPKQLDIRYNHVRQIQSAVLQKFEGAVSGVSESIDIYTDPRLDSVSEENVQKVIDLCRGELQSHGAVAE